MFKRNQVMITALAIMIAVAGYLNFAGTKVGEEELADVGASAGQESDMEALLELSDEDGKGTSQAWIRIRRMWRRRIS